MSHDITDIGLNGIRKVLDLWRAGKSDSLIDYTRPSRVEPLCLIDADLVFWDGTNEVMQSFLSQFCGWYLQAVALSATVGKVEVMRHLDKLNPRRNALDSAMDTAGGVAGWYLAQESYEHGLPSMKSIQIAMESHAVHAPLDILPLKISMEARNPYTGAGGSNPAHQQRQNARDREAEQRRREEREDARENRQNERQDARDKAQSAERAARDAAAADTSKFGVGKDTIQTVRELSNLSVGKLLTVNITDGQHSADIPVAVRLMANTLPSDSVVHILSLGQQDKGLRARIHGYRSGRLEFWRDIVGCQDLIAAHKKALMADKDGALRNIVQRKRQNQLAAVLSGNPSVATASNMMVISRESADRIEAESHIDFNSFKLREKVFEPTSLVMLAIVAKEYDRISFYYRGIPEKVDVSLRDLKASNKGNGPDVADILRAYQMGHAPSL